MSEIQTPMVPIDATARDDVLSSLLRLHPGALISAINPDGLFVDLPPSVELQGQTVIKATSALELVEPGCRKAIIEGWDRAKCHGASKVPVALGNGVDALFHFVDIRHRHGVLIGMIVAEAHVELAVALGGRTPVMPKTGRTEKDELAVIRAADDRICQILGYERDELIGLRSLDLLHPEDQDRSVDAWMEMLAAPNGTSRLRARHRRKDGSWLWLELTNDNRLAQSEGRVVTEMIDISEEMAAHEALRQREQLLGRLAEALPSGVLHVDHERRVVFANARLHHVVGVGQSATVDEQLVTVVADDRLALDAALDDALVQGNDGEIEVRLRIPGDPRVRLCSIVTRVLTDADGAPAGAVLCIDDVTEASELRAELERRATIDELTGCLNRAAVLDALDDILRRDGRSAGTATMFFDLDGFKEVNDTFGHTTGDQLLAGAANRLMGALRDGDVIGRLGGDEFIVVLADVRDAEEAARIGGRLRQTLAEPFEVVSGLPIQIRSSIGVAWTSDGEIDASALVAAADRAMYESKRVGAGELVFVAV